MSKAVVIKEENEVQRYLQALGVSKSVLVEAVHAGQIARDTCTENDPVSMPGIMVWARTTRSLRENLRPSGWKKRDRNNLPMVVSPNGDVGIIVCTGDDNTGSSDADPKTKKSRGPATVNAVIENSKQLPFDFFERMREADTEENDDLETWILLVSRVGEEIFFELSLPASAAPDGHIEKWKERLLFAPLDFNPEPDIDDFADEGTQVTVDVKKKGAE